MFFKLRDRLGRTLFNQRCRGILERPPVRILGSDHPLVLSQLQHQDVLMYLVAIKTFAARVPVGDVLILDDGSLTDPDRQMLDRHLPGVTIEPTTRYRSAHCPQGGTWERLLAIAHHAGQRYVVQLDADTVTRGELPDVNEAIGRGRCFALGTWDDQQVETFADRASDARRLNPGDRDHIQVAAEKRFDQVPGFESLRYVRGCSGFAGFAPGSTDLAFIESFSATMSQLLGSRWAEWGSEQVMSNVVLANSPAVDVLPHPRYCDCKHVVPETRFIHFIGDCRFTNGTYREAAHAEIVRLARL